MRRDDLADPEAREVWDDFFGPDPGHEPKLVDLWGFSWWCSLELGRVPPELSHELEVTGAGQSFATHLANMRRARREGRL